ncbi:MAG: XdhC family protein [Fidelibacterota bacterium]
MEQQLLNKLIHFDFSQKAALCSVVFWRGSVPRKDFPIMFIFDSGQSFGTIGGGTMEKTTIEQAKKVIKTDKASLEKYDFTNNDITNEGGLCGGVMEILIEPYRPEIQAFLRTLRSKLVLTSVNRQSFEVTRRVIHPSAIPPDLPVKLENLISSTKSTGESVSLTIDDTLYLVQKIQPPPLLHIFGGGHVGKAVADLAHFTELNLVIYDDRADFANKERFPFAIEYICAPLPAILKKIKINSNDLALIATRGHQHDLELLRVILRDPPRWVGLVSSRRKWKILAQALRDEGYKQHVINAVHAPVGLDINAQTVPEIAVSIIGDIIQTIREKH